MYRFALGLFLILNLSTAFAQKVGVVLSGGGAAGLAHIGVLKALEENQIPIDYITGTSMGALIGGMYSSGYTLQEIEALVQSKDFLAAIEGYLNEEDVYYFTRDLQDASLISLKFSTTDVLGAVIPTNLRSPTVMEHLFFAKFTQPAAAAEYNFDSLMIPFRCVAADIQHKEEVIFDSGNLSEAIRATTTYPFYFRPLMLDGKLLFDGGLYNNFPSDVMYEEFFPDIIIGSNVSATIAPPREDDILSQLKNMIVARTKLSVICENEIIIEPETSRGPFDFNNAYKEVELGYKAAMQEMPRIKRSVSTRRSYSELEELRTRFRKKWPPFLIDDDIAISGDISKGQQKYIRSVMRNPKDSVSTLSDFRRDYLRLAQDNSIRFVHPTAQYYPTDSLFHLNLYIKRERDLTLFFGGNFSSRPVNVGYLGIRYDIFGSTPTSIFANSYFGKFYGSVLLKSRFDFGGSRRLALEPLLTFNRWDYFKTYVTFFEVSRPSFIVKEERFGGINLLSSWGSNSIITYDIKYGKTEDKYYQNPNFSATDTADFTQFELWTMGLGVDRNTLNHKMYANAGTRLEVKARAVLGSEYTFYGSTSSDMEDSRKKHQWINFLLRYENYFRQVGPVTFGLELEALYSTKPLFQNYWSSIISAPAYTPVPESKTIFLKDFRAHKYGAFGLKSVVALRRNVEFRLEGYVFEPVQNIYEGSNNKAYFSSYFAETFFIGAGALVYHSPIGPLSLNANYYDQREKPWSIFLNFGYTLFNKSVYE